MRFDCVIFDVDDVVLNTDQAATVAEAAIREPLSVQIGREAAARVEREFSRGYDILRRELRKEEGEESPEFAALEGRIRYWQRGVLDAGFEVKLWSRDSLAAIALERSGVPVVADRVAAIAGTYWRVLHEKTEMHGDARALVTSLARRSVLVHLATNSDGFLRFDERARTFFYDPADSHERKLARMDCVRMVGLDRADVTIGDPVGKPNPTFYERVLFDLSRKVTGAIDRSRLLVVGDSLTNDVLPFLAIGAAGGVWLRRSEIGRRPERLDERPEVLVVGSLDDVEAIL